MHVLLVVWLDNGDDDDVDDDDDDDDDVGALPKVGDYKVLPDGTK